MTAITRPVRTTTQPIPGWAWAVLALAASLVWLITFENGQLLDLLGQSRTLMHELFHDGRHLLGVPCH